MDIAEAEANLPDIIRAFATLAGPPDMAELWRALIINHQVLGKQAHDARLAALMLAHGVTHILTLNPVDFTRYPGITPVRSQEATRLNM